MQQRDATQCSRGRAAPEALRLRALWVVITTTVGMTEEDDDVLLSRLAGDKWRAGQGACRRPR